MGNFKLINMDKLKVMKNTNFIYTTASLEDSVACLYHKYKKKRIVHINENLTFKERREVFKELHTTSLKKVDIHVIRTSKVRGIGPLKK